MVNGSLEYLTVAIFLFGTNHGYRCSLCILIYHVSVVFPTNGEISVSFSLLDYLAHATEASGMMLMVDLTRTGIDGGPVSFCYFVAF